jgi:hypothetical protein
VSDALTRTAQGRPCMFRGPGCDGGGWSGTTVLAHIRKAGICGVGIKPPSVIGFWSCHPCHALYDRRREEKGFNKAILDHYAFDALCRTLYELHQEGLIP